MEIETLTRKWGNSIVVIVPANLVEREKIKENERVLFKIEKKKPTKVRDIFGILKSWKKPTEEILKEARRGWD